MRKWLSYSIYTTIALTAIVLTLPYVLGLLAENRCNKIIELINTQTPLSAKIMDYKRGWFKAYATAEISLDKLDLKNKELYQLKVVANIDHGPMIMNWTRFYFAQAIINADLILNESQRILLNHNNKPIAKANIKLKLNGNTKINFNSSPLSYQNKEKDKSVTWKGLKIYASFSPSFDQNYSNIEFAGIDIKGKERDFYLGKITSNYQGEKSSSGLWLGKRNLYIESFTTQSIYNRILSLKKINVTSLLKEDKNNTADISTTININNININGGIYTQNKLNFDINNIKQNVLYNLLQQIFSKKILASPTSLGFDIFMALLNNGTEINIKKLNTNTPWGKLLAAIKIVFPDQPNNIGLLSTIANASLSADIKIKPELTLHLLEKLYQIMPSRGEPKNPAKQARDLLDEWQNSKKVFTVSDDGYLNVNLDYQGTQLLINKKPLTLTTKP